MAAVTVRYWAAARAAAGVGEEPGSGETLADVVAAARAAHGERLGRILDRCAYLVDEVRARPDTRLVEGAVVDVLPPFAGGADAPPATDRPARAARVAGWSVPVLCPVLAGAALIAMPVGVGALTGVVAVLQALLLAGWFGQARVPGGVAGAAVGGIAAAAVDLLLLTRDTEPLLVPVAWVLGPALLVAIVAQLLRGDGRAGVLASLTATITGTVLVVGGAWLVPASRPASGAAAVAAALAGAGVATVVAALGPAGRAPLEGRSLWVRSVLGLLLAGLAGAAAGDAAAGGAAAGGGGLSGAGLGAVTAAAAAAVATGAARLVSAPAAGAPADTGPGWPAAAARIAVGASLPLLLAGPPAYLLGRLLGG